jgi:ribosomal protein L32E
MARNSGGFWRKPTKVCERFEEMWRRPRGHSGGIQRCESSEERRERRMGNGQRVLFFG